MGELERVEALLDARLAAGATLASPPSLTLGSISVWTVAFGVALVGASAIVALKWPSEPPSESVKVAPATPVSAAPVAAIVESAAPPAAVKSSEGASAETVKAPLAAPTALTRGPRDRLALEVALLSRAASSLRAGHADEALETLDEHGRKFPNGFLTVERRAVRAQALCSLKRFGEGRAELARLAPQSPAAARTRQLCDAAAKVR